jgi:5'(3')-deoxyribonucleotidase
VRLGIDLDGVVADFNKGWIDQYNAEFGTDIAHDATTTWSGMVGLTHFPDMHAFWEWARDFGNGSIFRHLDTYPAALPALERLAQEHDLVIITTKPDWAVHDTFAWISDKKLPAREVHIVRMDAPKWVIDCDVYLEDAPHHLAELCRQRPDALVVRYVRPWNHPVEGVQDVADWHEFEQLVGTHAQERTSVPKGGTKPKEDI